MKGFLVLAAVLTLCYAASSQAAKQTSWCAVTPDPAASTADTVALHVAGAVPMKTVPYLRIDNSQSWTSLHNQKGVIDDWTGRTPSELPAGTTHTAEIMDAPNGVIGSTVVASCTFQT